MHSIAERTRWKKSLTPLANAVLARDFKEGKFREHLMASGDVDAVDCFNQTSLMLAIRSGYLEGAKLLLDAGANLMIRDIDGCLGVDYAAALGGNARDQAMSLLSEYATDVGSDGHRGRIISASAAGEADLVKQLTLRYDDVLRPGPFGDFALISAASGGHVEALGVLLGSGAKINVRNRAGDTALIAAARRGHLEATRLLVAAGADLFIPSQDDLPSTTARSFAVEQSHNSQYRAVADYLAEQERLAKRPSRFAKMKGIQNLEVEAEYLLVKANVAQVAAEMSAIARLPLRISDVVGRQINTGNRGYLLLQFEKQQWTIVYPMTLAAVATDELGRLAEVISRSLKTSAIEYVYSLEEGSRLCRYDAGQLVERLPRTGLSSPEDSKNVARHAEKMLRAEQAYLHSLNTGRWPSNVFTEVMFTDFTARDVLGAEWVGD